MAVFEKSLEELKNYYGINPKPDDFEKYWEETLTEVSACGTDYTLKKDDFSAPGLEFYHLYFTGLGGAEIHAKLVRPAHIEDPLPAIGVFHGYHHFSGSWFSKLGFAYSGKVVLSLDSRGQGGLSEDIIDADKETLFGHIIRGVEDPDPKKLLFRYNYADCVQAIRILKSLPYVDENRIGLTGNSQGGGLSIACAALEPVKKVAVIFPFLSDFKRVYEMDLSDVSNAYKCFWWHFRKKDPYHERFDEFWERLGYIDIQHHAPNVKADVLWFTGMMDQICPASTQFAAYNKITSEKEMRILPDYGHELDVFPFVDDPIFEFFNDL